MKLRKDNIHSHELLGIETIVLDKKFKEIARGTVYDETKETLTLKIGSEKKIFLKNSHIFLFKLNGLNVAVKGARLLGRPEERIKKI